MTESLRAQYEAHPYPARNPADEDRRLVSGSPSHLDQLNHYVFGGRLDFTAPLRVLVAGGGTGDAAIMLAQQCSDVGLPVSITYLDLSDAARRIALSRAARRGLTSITFHQGSLLELQDARLSGLGPFDYIDCCGVIHHLENPAAGLRALISVLAPGGGIGLMVYAPYGRSGVYPLQEALRTLTAGLVCDESLGLARRLLHHLPPGNGFRNNPRLGDHTVSDAGLFDLLLHSRDRAYTVPELAALVEDCGLSITGLIEPASYEPSSYVRDPRILKRLEALPWLERAAWAEQVGGVLSKHIAYLVRPHDAAGSVARLDYPGPDHPKIVPVLRDFDGAAMGRDIPPGAVLDVELPGVTLALPLPRLAGPILARIDGRTTLGEIFEQVTVLNRGLSWKVFKGQFDLLFAALNGIGKIYLRLPPGR
ncbi:MAG: class I SAM-dependent methyltransferase [Rhodospirillaceae bacterium]